MSWETVGRMCLAETTTANTLDPLRQTIRRFGKASSTPRTSAPPNPPDSSAKQVFRASDTQRAEHIRPTARRHRPHPHDDRRVDAVSSLSAVPKPWSAATELLSAAIKPSSAAPKLLSAAAKPPSAAEELPPAVLQPPWSLPQDPCSSPDTSVPCRKMSFPRYPAYKPSGVEWLGDVPEHWAISRLGFESWVRARLGWKGLKAEEYVDNGFAFLSTPNIKGLTIDFENVNFINQERFDESPEIKIREGDVLLAKDGSTLGTVNVVRQLPRPTTVNSSIAVITPNQSLDGVFLEPLAKP